MGGIGQFFINLGAWNWFVLAVALLVAETIIPGIHFMWFGMAAIIVGSLALALGDMLPWEWQLALFGAISITSVWLTRFYWRPRPVDSDQPTLNVRGSNYIGQVVQVETTFAGGRGRVRVGDTVWLAQGPGEIDAGESVRITGVDGTVLIVEPV